MPPVRLVVALVFLFLTVNSLHAQETLVGVWKVLSIETRALASGKVAKPLAKM